MKDLTHLSLFTGIGGLDLAAEWAGFKTVGQCEFADYPMKVLENHWPDVWRCKDIHDLRADEFYRQTGIGGITVISGGFPCQPHSVAGKRKASGDERDLWPEYRRVIDEFRPRWVVAENVRGLLSSEDGRFFRGILRDFADLGYDVGWCCYRAADVGAIHPRERIGIIAHARSERMLEWEFKKHSTEWNKAQYGAIGCHKITADPNSKFGQGVQSTDGNTDNERDKEQKERRTNWLITQLGTDFYATFHGGDKKYIKPLITRRDDGFSASLDRDKALGNAVAPPQFYPIFQAIAEIENFCVS